MQDAELVIAVQIIRPACKGEPDLTERLRKAMKEASTYWASTNDDLRFRAACGAAMLESPPDERERIRETIAAMRKVYSALNAASAGASVDIVGTLESIGNQEDLLPLRKMWDEIKEAA